MTTKPDPSLRDYWASVARKIAIPVLENTARGTLRQNMPVEKRAGTNRELVSHLEAFARLLAGIAPWLELEAEDTRDLADLARQGLDHITNPDSPDFATFVQDAQPLVDAAFLANALLRAPKILWEPLEPRVKQNVIQALLQVRSIKPSENNWLLFSAMVETGLHAFDREDWNTQTIDYAIRRHEEWYKGDGVYGDGPHYHADYYNSFVIQPMLADIFTHFRGQSDWADLEENIWFRCQRYATILERMISPEGTYPPIGRSIAYRFGAMQTLGQMALLHRLPKVLEPAQVREALTAVIRRCIETPNTFDENGWLRIGLCGSQPEVGETYISTGSLYLCSVGLLPLGLPQEDSFWSDPPLPWTSVKAWSGQTFPIDPPFYI
ncbi:MAG: DUF2264 domain-containing protein [Kiritimatiellia bacterium]